MNLLPLLLLLRFLESFLDSNSYFVKSPFFFPFQLRVELLDDSVVGGCDDLEIFLNLEFFSKSDSH